MLLVGAAAELPDETAASLLDVTRDAFVAGMQASAWIAAVLAAVVAAVALVTLRPRSEGAEHRDTLAVTTTNAH